MRIIEERADAFLDAGHFGGCKGIGRVQRNGELLFGAIGGDDPSMRRMLGSVGLWMLETVEGACDVAWEGHINNPLGVVPLEGETAV
jgi:hypothetical protein